MAVTKTLTGAVPYNKSSKVQQWDLEMKYNQGNKSASPSTYYESFFSIVLPATDSNGTVNFTPKAEGSWTLSELKALLPDKSVGYNIRQSVRQRDYQSA